MISEYNNTFLFSQNAIFIEELYNRFLKNPSLVDESWKIYFSQIAEDSVNFNEFFLSPSWVKKESRIIGYQEKTREDVKKQEIHTSVNVSHLSLKLMKLVDAFRIYGHLAVQLSPLNLEKQDFPKELDYKSYGIDEEELEQNVEGIFNKSRIKVRELYEHLLNTYSGRFAVEFFHMENLDEREWLRDKIENDLGIIDFSSTKKVEIWNSLMKVEMFEEYLHTKFPGAKRFSIEGGESTIIAVEEVIRNFSQDNVEEVVFGMAHRGRLSVLTKIMKKPYSAIFSEFRGGVSIPDYLNLPGDVKYHIGSSSDMEIGERKIHLSLTPNPSHLELVNSVVLGRVRAKQDYAKDKDKKRIVSVLLHGDAAFCGQGSVMECLALSKTSAYDVGGTIHIVTNNQIGFTTDVKDGRSSRYCTDIAKMIGAPIFHVNGDDPEAVAYVSKIASEYRLKFKKDVFIDIVCYRKYGHNEGDEPMFTQPKMYNVIRRHKTPSTIYLERLIATGSITKEVIERDREEFKKFLIKEYKLADNYKTQKADWLDGVWKGFDEFLTDKNKQVYTGVAKTDLKNLASALTVIPKNFTANSKIERLFKNRESMIASGENIDWGMGETLAYATLLKEGYNIRITGEDVKRGTFSHRHAVIVDQLNEDNYTPLNNLGENQNGRFEIHNSTLSELAVMGFEYGYSYSDPNTLVIWEAQYGDFANSAQMIIDQYIVSGKAKWLRMSGLVLLLPHGYEGGGPEHSSARLERYLQLCANNNIAVANCSTPASVFHLLRRQIHRNYRKPLIIMTPKSLLRHKLVVSKLEEFLEYTYFKVLIEDDLKVEGIRKVIFCSGKVYYELFEEREKRKRKDIALIRLEQLYPYPKNEIITELKKYKNVKQMIWCQEEHKNMGAWFYIKHQFDDLSKEMGSNFEIKYVGRNESASSAAGYMKLHLDELNEFLNKAFE